MKTEEQYNRLKAENAQLREDLQETDAIRERCAQLLAETAVALKGPEKALHRHGWQDLPEAAIKLRAELAHAKLFAPAQRTERTPEPVNAVGPLNEAYWFGLEAAEKDFDVFGKPYQEVTA